MYDRFTDRARRALQLAHQEAQRFNHDDIGTEHLLLGVIKEGRGVAALLLENLGVALRRTCREVERVVQPGGNTIVTGQLQQTPGAKNVIEYAMEEARSRDQDFVGTEHLLLGLLREREGVAVRILTNLGLEPEDVRRELMNLHGEL